MISAIQSHKNSVTTVLISRIYSGKANFALLSILWYYSTHSQKVDRQKERQKQAEGGIYHRHR